MADNDPLAGMCPAIGDVWKEIDPRVERYVRVVATNGEWIRLRTCDKDGAFTSARVTRAAFRRFHGMRGGYALVSELPCYSETVGVSHE